MHSFDIPVVIFIFKRMKALEIIDRISKVKPRKLYILSDHGRDEKERSMVEEVRKSVEEHIDWDCEIIKKYAEENIGVYENIGLGALWVFEREEKAIFLEDDNLPEVTFFDYCKELLEMYKTDDRILWICGTNYLENYAPADGASYVFTNHLLPCGWASWSHKFTKYYDKDLSLVEDEVVIKRMKKNYFNNRIYKQYKRAWKKELNRKNENIRFNSWDYHMEVSLKANSLYGISPSVNQIKNIGADSLSTHGGTNIKSTMTNRFCSIESSILNFPLEHPKTVLLDTEYNRKVYKILVYPLKVRVKNLQIKIIRKFRSLIKL